MQVSLVSDRGDNLHPPLLPSLATDTRTAEAACISYLSGAGGPGCVGLESSSRHRRFSPFIELKRAFLVHSFTAAVSFPPPPFPPGEKYGLYAWNWGPDLIRVETGIRGFLSLSLFFPRHINKQASASTLGSGKGIINQARGAHLRI